MTELRPSSHRRPGPRMPRWLAAGSAAALAAAVGGALLLQNGGAACAAPPTTSANDGKATYYDLGGGTGNCSFAESPSDGLFVALGPSQYSSAAACGMYLDVTGPKGKVRVKVTDQCPECAAGHLDLSRTAFKKIGAEVDGIIPITYEAVGNPSVPEPISVRIKEGASQYWFAALIDNHGTQLSSVRVAGPDGTYRDASRTTYNYWLINGGAGPGPYRLKITDVAGRTATVTGITMSPGEVQRTTAELGGSSSGEVKAPPPSSSPTSAPTPTPTATKTKKAKATTRSTTSAPAAAVVPAAAATTTPVRTAVDLAGAPSTCK